MDREHRLARLFRALSGRSQAQTAERLGADPSLIAQIELGKARPGPERLERLAQDADLTVAVGDEILQLAQTERRSRAWRGPGLAGLLDESGIRLRAQLDRSFRHLQTLQRLDSPPRPEDRPQAATVWEQIKEFSREALLAVIQVEERLQTWAMCDLLCEASVREASRDLERAATLAQAAQAVAELVRGPERWLSRLKAYAAAHWANILRVQGELNAADAELESAKRLWQSGSDPAGVLDPGRLLHFEASLRRDQRRFTQALSRLDEAAVISHRDRALISKGFTFEVMGEYERAIETLLEAQPLVDRRTEPRDWYTLHFNLAVNFTHGGHYGEAADLALKVRGIAAELGDDIFLNRVTWLRGRIAAGLGMGGEARRLLEEARLGFATHEMFYDVALALLEEAVLMLDEGRTAEVKALTPELAKVFESKGVHREALAALRLFQEAVEREEATAELARNVLRYLFRARHDQDLRFKVS